MKAPNQTRKIELYVTVLAVVLILFWLFAAGIQLSNFNKFKGEMNNQIFSRNISGILAYLLPTVEITIAALLICSSTRLAGMILSVSLLAALCIYVGLALLNVYSRMPCNCAGLLGSNSTWAANFKLNLFVTAVAATGLILIIRNKERRTKVWIQ